MEMYWYTNLLNKNKTIAHFAIGAIVLFQSCSPSSPAKQNRQERFFDLPSYFSAEVKRLANENPLINKEVYSNGESEQKELQIKDWNNELSSFLNIDLNKDVYRDIIVKDSIADTVYYSFKNNEVDLKHVKMIYTNGEVVEVEIETKSKNLLFETEENLHYSKGKNYSIEKVQHVKLLGGNKYKIIGRIK